MTITPSAVLSRAAGRVPMMLAVSAFAQSIRAFSVTATGSAACSARRRRRRPCWRPTQKRGASAGTVRNLASASGRSGSRGSTKMTARAPSRKALSQSVWQSNSRSTTAPSTFLPLKSAGRARPP